MGRGMIGKDCLGRKRKRRRMRRVLEEERNIGRGRWERKERIGEEEEEEDGMRRREDGWEGIGRRGRTERTIRERREEDNSICIILII